MVHLITICLLYLTTNNVNKIFAKGQYSQRSIHHSDQCTVGQASYSIDPRSYHLHIDLVV